MNKPDPLIVQSGLVASVMSVFLASFYVLLRLGFETSWRDVSGVAALSLFLVLFPGAWGLALNRTRRLGNAGWIASPALGMLVAILSIVALSSACLPWAANFSVLCVGLLIVGLMTWFWQSEARRAWQWASVFAGAGLAFWAAGVLWASGYLDPLFLENLALHGGTGHIDPLFHAALANMVTVYKSVSIGMDGPAAFHYHFGSHWLFGRMARLLGMNALVFYQLGYVVIVPPLFFVAFATLVASVRRLWAETPLKGPWNSSAFVAGVFLVAVVGILPASAMNGVGVWSSGPLISESYGLALLLSFAGLSVALDYFFPRSASPPRKRAWRLAEDLILIGGAPLIIAWIAFTKISVGAIVMALGLYLVVRLPRLHRTSIVLALLTSAAAFILSLVAVSPREEGSFALFSFIREYVPLEWVPLFPTVHFLWVWAFIIGRVFTSGIRTLEDINVAVRERRLIDVEAVVVVAIAGVIPGTVMDLRSDAFYFSDVQRWIALAGILGCVPLVSTLSSAWDRFRADGVIGFDPKKIVALVLGVPAILSIFVTILKHDVDLLRSNVATRREVYALASASPQVALHVAARASAKSFVSGDLAGSVNLLARQVHPLYSPALLKVGMSRASGQPIIGALISLSGIPEAARRDAALFIPQDFDMFWHLLRQASLCKYAPFVGPALSGLTLIDGVPPIGCALSYTYGEMVYNNRMLTQQPDDTLPAQLCRRAAQAGVHSVYALRVGDKQDLRFEVVECNRQTRAIAPPR